MKNLVATAMSYEGVGGGFRDEPELLQFATERYVEAALVKPSSGSSSTMRLSSSRRSTSACTVMQYTWVKDRVRTLGLG